MVDLKWRDPSRVLDTWHSSIVKVECSNCGCHYEYKQTKTRGSIAHCPSCHASEHKCKPLFPKQIREVAEDNIVFMYQCDICGFKQTQKATPNDNYDLINGYLYE